MPTTFTHTFVYELVTLFVILDPVSTIPIFLAATAGLARKEALKVAAYAVSIAFGVLLFFIAGGQFLLEALHIPMPSFQLAGSIVLLLFGLKLVLGTVTEEAAAIPAGDVAVRSGDLSAGHSRHRRAGRDADRGAADRQQHAHLRGAGDHDR